MRIAYFTNTYPRATDTFIQREVMGLRAKGLDIRTFSVRRTGSDHDVGDEVIGEKQRTFYILPAQPLRLFLQNLSQLIVSPIRYMGALSLAWRTAQPGLRGMVWQLFYFQEALVLAEELRRQGIAHLHNHLGDASGTVTMLASRLTGIGYSMTIHGSDVFFDPTHWGLREKVKYARFIVCISHFCKSQMMLFSDREDWERLVVVHCGVDLNRYSFTVPARRGNKLLYTGRLAAEKGLPVLFESLAMLKEGGYEFQMTLLGDGPDRELLDELAVSRGIRDRLVFAGFASQDGVRDALQQSDIFVLPSFFEGVPVALMEAMACGVPVIATYVGGVVELIEPGRTGQLVSPGDPVALRDAIVRYLDDFDFRAQIASQGREKVAAAFDLHREVDELAELFRQYVGKD